MPMNRKDYPPNWEDMALLVKARAGETRNPDGSISREACCEDCGRTNHEWIHRTTSDKINPCLNKTLAITNACGLCERGNRPIQIVLTTAHLDHDNENDDVCPDRLRAWCQKCHLAYDAPMRQYNRDHKAGQQHLFPVDF